MPINVAIELSIGIPSAVVLYSVLGYGGAFSGGTKCNPKPTIDLDKAGAASMTVPTLAWATTKRYNEGDAVVVAGKPDWFRSLRSGATELESKQLARAPDNLDVQFSQVTGATHAVKFTVAGPNPLLSLAPAIDAEIVVWLRKAGTFSKHRVQLVKARAGLSTGGVAHATQTATVGNPCSRLWAFALSQRCDMLRSV